MEDTAPSDLYRLMYISSSPRALPDDQIEALLEQSSRNNAAAGITGLLIYIDGHFLQYIEGRKAAVLALATRIEADRRHNGVIRLLEGPCDRRAFSDWSMGYRRLGTAEATPVAGAVNLARQPMRENLPAELPRELAVFMQSFYATTSGLSDDRQR
jgi:Sensors of blue-light using FAD